MWVKIVGIEDKGGCIDTGEIESALNTSLVFKIKVQFRHFHSIFETSLRFQMRSTANARGQHI